MANVAAFAGPLSFIIKAVTSVRFANAVATRSYSVFPTSYIKPTVKKEDQKVLEATGEILTIAHTPILPALSCETSSEFYDPEVSKFINFIMRKGKKRLARQQLERAFTNVKRIQLRHYHLATPENRHNIELDPVKVFHMAVENATPVMELSNMKKGGVTYQVPVPLKSNRQRFHAMNWLIQAAKEKNHKIHLPESLANELVDAANNTGRVVKRKQDLHKKCEENRAYAHFRWL